MGDTNTRKSEVLRVHLALAVVVCLLVALVSACGGDDDAGGGGADAGPDSSTDWDAGGDAGDDGGADADSDGDTDSAPPGCDPMVCDDACYAGGKKSGQCVGALCECAGDRDVGGCDCRATGGHRKASSRGLFGLLLQ